MCWLPPWDSSPLTLPTDPLAPQWFERLREFAINSYSHPSDQHNQTVIDPEYDNKTVADLYQGQNLYDDYSLQNHNLFHTSYQNVVLLWHSRCSNRDCMGKRSGRPVP